MSTDPIVQAAKLIASADGLLITAGAGMGVDSGLPDFRGKEGFWKAYPALAASGMNFTAIANPEAFSEDARVAWGFYGHRLALYRKTIPHAGFTLLRKWADQMPSGAFVITSNVDGQFQKAGFADDAVYEIHGSIHHLQCCLPCSKILWSADAIEPVTNDETCEWIGNVFPTCVRCGQLARPNILMFDDWGWSSERSEMQRKHWRAWSSTVGKQVVIELGAGVDISSIRQISENQECPIIRINPRHPDLIPGKGLSLNLGAQQALMAISSELKKIGWEG